ncbi:MULTISPECIES: hypothetical protein [Thalassospira]|uniref:Uncharacterized protein n=1 Tax=Thalassospira profundimaris TaxID=502049 RepID=A0A367WYH6_9PROT|nr:hypothetical protein [Thalassospira profundimaris]RCK45472.1 hypothetical protein TH30_12890 [Thalassospira profundimaris]
MADDDNTNPDASGNADNAAPSENAEGSDPSGTKAAAGGADDSKPSSDADSAGDSTGAAANTSSPASTPPLSTALNPQIVQAVGTTNHAVLNGAIPGANGVAYQKVAQAAAYAVQDSTDYLRNIMSMASATTGVAMQQMLVKKEVDPYANIIKAATQAVTDAQKTFASVGESASSVVKDFDSLA